MMRRSVVRSNPKTEMTEILMRVDKDGNVVFLFQDKEWAKYTNSMREKKGSVKEYTEMYNVYYLVTFSPEEYSKHYEKIRPYQSLVTHRNNAEQILERFTGFYNRLGLNTKNELSDITDLLQYDINNVFDFDKELDISFSNYPEYIIAKLNTPDYYNMLMHGLKQYNVPQACIKLIQSLLAEDLDQRSMVLCQEKLNIYCNHPQATYSYDNFEQAQATKDQGISKGIKFTLHEENRRDELEKHAEQKVYLNRNH
jgi:hypothetical protein